MSFLSNPYLPMQVRIDSIVIENDAKDLKTFRLVFVHESDARTFRHKCGQFAMLSVAGAGEIPIGIASSPNDEGYVEFTIKRYSTGMVTDALHTMSEGDIVGIRGPMGNSFPLESLEGRNLVIIGGGFAFTTLRATIRYLRSVNVRRKYGDITILYGARTPGDLLYKNELLDWQRSDDTKTFVTVDKADGTWKGREGMVPTILSEIAPKADNATCIVCGPPIMIKFTMLPLLKLGFTPDTILSSLERKMSCGIGKCGRCNIGNKFVCKDGPVFTYAEMLKMGE